MKNIQKWLSVWLAMSLMFVCVPLGNFAETEDLITEEKNTIEEAEEKENIQSETPVSDASGEVNETINETVEEEEEKEKEAAVPPAEEEKEPQTVITPEETLPPEEEDSEEDGAEQPLEEEAKQEDIPASEDVETSHQEEPSGEGAASDEGKEEAGGETQIPEEAYFEPGLAYLMEGDIYTDAKLRLIAGTVETAAVVFAAGRMTGEGELSDRDVIRIIANIQGVATTLYIRNGQLNYLSEAQTAEYEKAAHEESIQYQNIQLDEMAMKEAEPIGEAGTADETAEDEAGGEGENGENTDGKETEGTQPAEEDSEGEETVAVLIEPDEESEQIFDEDEIDTEIVEIDESEEIVLTGEAESEDTFGENEELELNAEAPAVNLVETSIVMGIDGTAKFTANVTNTVETDVIIYVWQVSPDKGSTWEDVSDQPDSNSYSVKVKEAYYGQYRFRCQVTVAHEDGTTDEKASHWGQIKAWTVKVSPSSVTAGVGKTAKFSATPSGSKGSVKYQWQYSWNNGTNWSNIDYTTKTASIKVKKGYNECIFRVKATANNGIAYSKPISIKAPGTLSMNKAYARVDLGQSTSFTVSAPSSLKASGYEWYYSVNAGKSWRVANSKIGTGVKTKTLKLTATNALYEYTYACLVTTSQGKIMSPYVYIEPKNAGKFQYAADGSFLQITGYTGTEANLTIPSGLGGLKVRKIGASALNNNTTIQSVTIPPEILTIGNSAFEECSKLKKVVLSDNVKSIGEAAFMNCVALKIMSIQN